MQVSDTVQFFFSPTQGPYPAIVEAVYEDDAVNVSACKEARWSPHYDITIWDGTGDPPAEGAYVVARRAEVG